MRSHRIFLFLTIAMAGLAFAQTPAAKAPKIAIVNMSDAVVGTTDGVNANQALETEFGPRKTKLDQDQQALSDLVKRLEQDNLSDAERQKISKEVDDRTILVDLETEQDDADLDAAQKKVMAALGKKMMGVIIDYAAAKGYVMVFDISTSQAPLLYADNATDITSEVIAAYEAKYKGTAGR